MFNSKEELKEIKGKQDLILSKLTDLEYRAKRNTDVIMDYLATYRDKKQYRFCEVLKRGHFTKNQLDILQELANILKDVISDKEELEEQINGKEK